jgi:hypothetical protein
MIIAKFVSGPMDGTILPLPLEEPIPVYVIPRPGLIMIPLYYLLAGQIDYTVWNYLYDELYTPEGMK